MKFIEIKLEGEKSHYINVRYISYVHNNEGMADIYIINTDKPLKTNLKYEEVTKLIINAPNF